MQDIVVRNRQTLLDVAMRESGDVEAAMLIAFANGMSLTDDLIAGQLIKTVAVVSAETANVFYKENRHPASVKEILVTESEGGIEFWAIEDDFTVD